MVGFSCYLGFCDGSFGGVGVGMGFLGHGA